jgi:hypothetical protein
MSGGGKRLRCSHHWEHPQTLNRTCIRGGVRRTRSYTHTRTPHTPHLGEAIIVRIPKMCYAACLPTTRSPDRSSRCPKCRATPAWLSTVAGAWCHWSEPSK